MISVLEVVYMISVYKYLYDFSLWSHKYLKSYAFTSWLEVSELVYEIIGISSQYMSSDVWMQSHCISSAFLVRFYDNYFYIKNINLLSKIKDYSIFWIHDFKFSREILDMICCQSINLSWIHFTYFRYEFFHELDK